MRGLIFIVILCGVFIYFYPSKSEQLDVSKVMSQLKGKSECESDPDSYNTKECLLETKGDGHYYVTQEEWDKEILPFQKKLKNKASGTYALKLFSGEELAFEVSHEKVVAATVTNQYCICKIGCKSRTKNYMNNKSAVKALKPFMLVRDLKQDKDI